jgi:signal peptidase II
MTDDKQSQQHAYQLRWLWLSALVVIIDQVSKHLATALLKGGPSIEVLPVVNLTWAQNFGAAFSIFANAGGWQRWVFIILTTFVSMVLVVWIKRLKGHETWLAIALALVLGGALGNLYDRIFLGYVVDFVSVHYQRHYFPVFNLADSAITIGAVMLIIDTFWLSRQSKIGNKDER